MKVRQFTTWPKSGSRGMTLLELMVAMLVLLVGIWTIAAGFPKLLASITSEGARTEMARLVQRNMERLKDTEGSLPWAIFGDPTISPYSEPDDLTEPSRPANAQENLLDVIGEAFQIPGVQPAGATARASSAYVLQQGPAQWADVYILIPLTQQHVDPDDIGGKILENSFYVDEANGKIIVPDTVYTYDGAQATGWDFEGESVTEPDSGLLINYAWAATASANSRPPIHYVQDEKVIARAGSGDTRTFTVRAKSRDEAPHKFACLIEGNTSVQAMFYFYQEAASVAEPSGHRHYVLNNEYGVELNFHRDDGGLTAYVDYLLRDVDSTNTDSSAEAGRRKLMMIEDHVITSEAVRTDDETGDRYTDIKLTAGNLNAEVPLFSQDLTGTELTPAVYLLAVDLTTGDTYPDGVNTTLYDDTLSPELLNGFRDGVVAVKIGTDSTQEAYVGHTWRFYYATLDYHSVQLQKPARTFVDIYTAETYNSDAAEREVNYRTYQMLIQDDTNVSDMDRIVLEFVGYVDDDDDPGTPPVLVDSAAVEGHTVSVDYAWYDADNLPHYVYGEMHTVPPGANQIALQHFSYHSPDMYAAPQITAVRGVSARTLAWWLTRKGRQQHVAIDSYTLKGPLGFTHRIR